LARVVLKNITKTFAGGSHTANTPDTSDASDTSDTPKASNTRPVLSNIDLTVNDGEFMVLVGPSGCGKSTLLRLISGLETLTNGAILVGDRTITHLPPKQRDIAMVFQSYALYPHLSVYDNLAFGLRRTRTPLTQNFTQDLTPNLAQNLILKDPEQPPHSPRRPAWLESMLVGLTRGLSPKLRYQSAAERSIAQRVYTVAKMLQIEDLLSRLPKQLSGGQKQRVALGRAMARNPQVFLMDEPLSNLDAKLRNETRAQIVGLQKKLATTTIYVTHDQTEAMTMGDRIAIMHQGRIQQVAPPLEIYRNPANRFVAAFIGSPPMNFLPVTVRANQLTHAAFSIALPTHWQSAIAPYRDGSTLLLGIRPEHISIGQCPGSFAATVTQIEALGSETFVMAQIVADQPVISQSLAAPVTSLQIRIGADQPIEPGSTLQVSFPTDKIHLFDTVTEAALELR